MLLAPGACLPRIRTWTAGAGPIGAGMTAAASGVSVLRRAGQRALILPPIDVSDPSRRRTADGREGGEEAPLCLTLPIGTGAQAAKPAASSAAMPAGGQFGLVADVTRATEQGFGEARLPGLGPAIIMASRACRVDGRDVRFFTVRRAGL